MSMCRGARWASHCPEEMGPEMGMEAARAVLLEKLGWFLHKFKVELIYGPAMPPPGLYSKEMEQTKFYPQMFTDHCPLQPKKVETTHIFVN